MAELIIHSGKYQGRKLLINDGEVVIGRDNDCNIRLASSDVSRKHCMVKIENEVIVVEDLNSQNGTYVNDLLIQKKTELEPGDFLRVGPMVFRVPGEKKVDSKHSFNLRPSAESSATDDDIASWLTDEESTDVSNAAETTIVQGKQKGPRKFGSVAEEAADIIMRHWQKLKEEEEEEV